MIKTILYDLDGTLLPMDQDIFTKAYFKAVVKKMIPRGYDSEKLIKVIWEGTGGMVMNSGDAPNEESFWKIFFDRYPERNDEESGILCFCCDDDAGHSLCFARPAILQFR